MVSALMVSTSSSETLVAAFSSEDAAVAVKKKEKVQRVRSGFIQQGRSGWSDQPVRHGPSEDVLGSRKRPFYLQEPCAVF